MKLGVEDGLEEGDTEGVLVGEEDGLADGDLDGLEVGLEEGLEETVGCALGCAEGEAVGDLEGSALGTNEGLAEMDGFIVGDADGEAEGLVDVVGDEVLFLLLLLPFRVREGIYDQSLRRRRLVFFTLGNTLWTSTTPVLGTSEHVALVA